MNAPHTLESLIALSKTPEGLQRLRIMVAELCGWNPNASFACKAWTLHPSGMIGPFVFDLPEYTASLDAMAEAERTMSYQEHCDYADLLNFAIIEGPAANKSTFATARQRAIALILTLQARHKPAEL